MVRYSDMYLHYLQGCSGTTRLPGAGKVTYKEGALFGPPISINPIATINKNREGDDDDYRIRYQTRRKVPLIKKTDAPVVGLRSDKNFISANAVEAILQGDFHEINGNKCTMHYSDNPVNTYSYYVVPKSTVSKELNYLKKEDYGKVPEYLTKVREEIQRENEMIDRYVKVQMGEADKEPEKFDEMSDFERQDLILSLKDKWDAVNARYQKITHLVQLDNNCQIRRKEQLEAELKTLETDIKYLSQPGALLVKH